MRYLSTREIFLENLKLNIKDIEQINEVVTNEITFGGSLLGRFINSVIRKAKIGYNYLRVDSIVKAIEGELNNIIFDGLSDEDKNRIKKLLAESFLSEIEKVCNDASLEESKKIKQLIGNDGNSGLVEGCKKWIETLNDEDEILGIQKQQLLENLENFRNDVNDLKTKTDEKTKLIEDVYKLLEDTVNLIDLVAKTGSVTSITTSNIYSSIVSDKNNLDFGKIIIGSSSISQQIVLTAKDVTTQPIDFSFTQPDFKLSFDNVTFNSHAIFNPAKKDFTKDVFIKFEPKSPKGKIDSQLKIFGGGLTASLNINLSGYKEISSKVYVPIYGPLKKGKKYYVEIDGKKKGPIYFIDYDSTTNKNKFQNRKGNIIKRDVTEPLFENTNYLDTLFENYIFNSFLFEEAMINPSEIIRANKRNRILIKKINKKNLVQYLRKNKQDNKIDDIIEFYNKLKDPSFTLSGPSAGIDVIDIESLILNMDNLSKQLNSYDEYFWKEEDIENKDSLEDWKKLCNSIKESNYSGITASCKDAYDNYFSGLTYSTISEKERKELEEQIENSKTVINIVDEAGRNRLLKIVELFGKAYSCFATDLIPSGRPGGRISTKTRNEYFYIGTGTPRDGTEDVGPGFGPWANKLVFRKFGEDITKLISYEKYQKILGNATIETKDGKKEGNVLLTFMRDMIDQNNLKNFDEKRSDFLTKYFGLKTKLKPSERIGGDIPETDNEDGVKWVAESFKTDTLKEGMFIAICCKLAISPTQWQSSSTKIVGYVAKIEGSKVLIKFQVGSYAPVRAYSDYDSLPAKANLGLKGLSKKNTYIAAFKMPLENGRRINMTAAKISNINDTKTFTIEIESGSYTGSTSRQFPPGILYAKDEPVINQNPKSKSTKITDDQELNIKFAFEKLTADANFGKDVIKGSYKPIPGGFI